MFVRTPRLTLRPPWPEDARAITAAVGFESVATRLGRVPWPYTEADAAGFIAGLSAADDVVMLILAHEALSPKLIGCVGLHALPNGGT